MSAFRLLSIWDGRHIKDSRAVKDFQSHAPVWVYTRYQGGLCFGRILSVLVTKIRVVDNSTNCRLHTFSDVLFGNRVSRFCCN